MIATLAACTVILVHGGGFGAGPVYAGDVIRELPVKAVELDYRLHDVPGSYGDAATLAARLRSRPGPLVMYGESAGGTIAAWSAAYKRVDAAVTVGAPVDLRRWTSPQPSRRTEINVENTAWKWSPLRVYEGQRPVFQFHYEVDPAVAREGQRLPRSRYTVVPGPGHMVLTDGGTKFAIRAACAAG